MAYEDLTEEEIANLSIEMRCCYFLHPWNKRMTGTTVEEWARQLGFTMFTTDSIPVGQGIHTAIKQATELVKFVKNITTVKKAEEGGDTINDRR